MALETRIAQLEAEIQPNACTECRSWPAYRIEGLAGATLDGAPARVCPRCGRAVGKVIMLGQLATGEGPLP